MFFPNNTNLPTLLEIHWFSGRFVLFMTDKNDFRLISCIQYPYRNWFDYEKWYSFSSQHPGSFFLLSQSSHNFSSTICAVTLAKNFPLFFAWTPCKCVSLTQRLQNCLIWISGSSPACCWLHPYFLAALAISQIVSELK